MEFMAFAGRGRMRAGRPRYDLEAKDIGCLIAVLLILGDAAGPGFVVDGGEEGEDFLEEGLVEGFFGPFDVVGDVFGAGGADEGGGDVGVGEGVLDGEFGDVDSAGLAEFGGGGAGGADVGGGGVPGGGFAVAEEAHGEG